MSGSIWSSSSFLDLTGYGLTTATTPAQAFGITSPTTATGTVTVALVLPRSNDPTSLLNEGWAQREARLNGLSQAQVGAEFGATTAQYNSLMSAVTNAGGTVLPSSEGYVSSAASRTLWVSLNSASFDALFGQTLQSGTQTNAASGLSPSVTYWDGNLTPSASLPVLAGMWVVTNSQPGPTDQAPVGISVALPNGPQGVGNTAGGGYGTNTGVAPNQELYPDQIASEYDFPLTVTGASGTATPTIGLIEPRFGDSTTSDQTVAQANAAATAAVAAYRAEAGIGGTGAVGAGTGEPVGSGPGSQEQALDLGVVAASAPNSNIVTYVGNNNVENVYLAFEQAIWGGGPTISDLSSSVRIGERVPPNSPFFAALQGLYQDAALNNISVFQASGDGGSSALLGTGVTQVNTSDVSQYTVSVGGTSTSSQAQIAAAGAANGGNNINAAVATLAQDAAGGQVPALETLIAGGLTQLPNSTSAINDFLQTTWNQYNYDANAQTLSPGYQQNAASGGAVDPAIPEPAYQTDEGIDVAALDGGTGTGKGDPDVSALAGGNTHYLVPAAGLSGLASSGGTSASSPLWESLSAQIQAIFLNQGLPTTGYYNDLIYQAAAIDPGSFNDVQFGSNTSSFALGGAISEVTNDNGTNVDQITPTGFGYTAGPGYDLTTGLGAPDGILLARALTQIAQAQEYSPNATPISDPTGLISEANQALIVQPDLASGFSGGLTIGGAAFTPASEGSGQGWSAKIAQQVLQSYFAPGLVNAIAGQSQASSEQVNVTDDQSLAVSIAGASADPMAQQDTTAFGYVTDESGGNSVTLARPLAVAETYGGENNVNAIVRIRQDSPDTDSLSFYRVDDLDGTVNGIAPGQPGYAAAAAGRAYSFNGGSQSVTGPGDGQFLQTEMGGVSNGNIIGFQLTDQTTGQVYWGLASQNDGDANALWSYGANTWGFDDGSADGQGSYSDLVFQLDFTSNAGSGLLVNDTSGAAAISVTGAAAGQQTSDEQPIEPFQTVSINDPNLSQTDTVTITLSGAQGLNGNANGTLTGAGLTELDSGTYQLAAGSPAQVTAALQSLVFTPTAGQVDAGHKVPTTFTLNITDSAGQYVTDDGTSVTATSAPFVLSDTAFPGTGDLAAGATIGFSLRLKQAVSVTGTPELQLNDGGVATYSGGSGTATLTFTTQVSPGQNAAPCAVTGVVLPAGAAAQTSAGQAADLNGADATFAGLQVDTVAPVVAATSLRVAPDSGATPIGVSASDNETAAEQLGVTITALPSDGSVTLAGSGAAVTQGESLTGAQLAGLQFTPQPGIANAVSAFGFAVTDGAGNSTSASAALDVVTPPYQLPTPVNGISTPDLSSLDLSNILGQGTQLAFLPGTEAVQLLDGILSIGPDTSEAFLARLYAGLFNTSAPDQSGISYADQLLQTGTSQVQVATDFLASAQGQATFATLSDAQFVSRLFDGLLGRVPSGSEQSAYDTVLAGGTTRGAVLQGIASSAEAKAYLAADTSSVYVRQPDAALVYDLYQTAFGADPDVAGAQFATAELLTGGLTPIEVAKQFTMTPPFQANYGTQANSAYVTELYQNGPGRAPSAAELAADVNGLSVGGYTRATVLLQVASSPEALGHLTRIV